MQQGSTESSDAGTVGRLAEAFALMTPCRLCELRCGVDRGSGEVGLCGLGDQSTVYGLGLQFGEEQFLVPSLVVALAGCNLGCSFCSEHRALRPPFPGERLRPEELAARIRRILDRRPGFARNINFVGAEPSLSLPFLLATSHALGASPDGPPLLLNTNGYLTPEALRLCSPEFGIFVVDFKFGRGDCARNICGIEAYFETLTRNIRSIDSIPAEPLLVIRHLLLPGHLSCCTAPILDWLQGELPNVLLNVMSGFVPFPDTPAPRHWPPLSSSEQEQARVLLHKSGLSNVMWDGGPLVA